MKYSKTYGTAFDRHRIKIALFFCTSSLLTLLNCSSVGNTLSSLIISDEEEIRLGARFKQEILADKENYPLYTAKPGYSTVAVKYIDSLGGILAQAQNDRPDLEFTFTVIDNDTMINAFAIPGGHVFIYTGLLLEAENGAEVAGVLAHEIGHITKYHGRNMLVGTELAGLAQQVLFGDSSTVTIAVSSLVTNMAFLKFSRNNELEADSCAVVYTSNAGINPRGMYTFLKKLGYNGKFEVFSEVFKTHPDVDKRLESVLETILRTHNAPAEGTKLLTSEYASILSELKTH